MSDSSHSSRPGHATPLTYIRVAFVLAVITAVEVGIFYFDMPGPVFVGIFFILSATKFALVVMFYMHLKYDARLFSGFFLAGILLAVSMVIAVMALFGVLLENPTASKVAIHVSEPIPVVATRPMTTLVPSATSGETPVPAIDPVSVFTAMGCSGCHAIAGVSSGPIGPPLDGIAIRAASRVSGLSAEEYIRESITEPGAFVVKDCPSGDCAPVMPSLRSAMTDAEFESLVAYLLTLK